MGEPQSLETSKVNTLTKDCSASGKKLCETVAWIRRPRPPRSNVARKKHGESGGGVVGGPFGMNKPPANHRQGGGKRRVEKNTKWKGNLFLGEQRHLGEGGGSPEGTEFCWSIACMKNSRKGGGGRVKGAVGIKKN